MGSPVAYVASVKVIKIVRFIIVNLFMLSILVSVFLRLPLTFEALCSWGIDQLSARN
jgi:hypothetical protein